MTTSEGGAEGVRARLEARAAQAAKAAKAAEEQIEGPVLRLQCLIDNALWRAAARRWLHRETRLRFCRSQDARWHAALQRREFDAACAVGHAAWAVQRTLARQAAAETLRASVAAQRKAAEFNARVVRARGKLLTQRVHLKGAIDRKLALASVRRTERVTVLRERLFAHDLRHEENLVECRKGLRDMAYQLERKLSAAAQRHEAQLEVVKTKAKVQVAATQGGQAEARARAARKRQTVRLLQAAERREQAIEAKRRIARAVVCRQRLVRARVVNAAEAKLERYEAKLKAAAERRDANLACVRERAGAFASTKAVMESVARTRKELRTKLTMRLEAAAARRAARMPGAPLAAFDFGAAAPSNAERALFARSYAARKAKAAGEALARRLRGAEVRRAGKVATRIAFAASHNARVPDAQKRVREAIACLSMAAEAKHILAAQRRLASFEGRPCHAINRRVATRQVLRRRERKAETLRLADKMESAAMRHASAIRPAFAIEANKRVLIAANRLLFARVHRYELTKLQADAAEGRREEWLGNVIGRAGVSSARVRTAKIYRECASNLAAMRHVHKLRMAAMRRDMHAEFSYARVHNAKVDAALEARANDTAISRVEYDAKLERAELRRSNVSPGLTAQRFNARVTAVQAIRAAEADRRREELNAKLEVASALRERVALAAIKDRAEALGTKAVEEAQTRRRRKALRLQIATDAKLDAAAARRATLKSPREEGDRISDAQARRAEAEALNCARLEALAARAQMAERRRQLLCRSIQASAGLEMAKVKNARARIAARGQARSRRYDAKLESARERRFAQLELRRIKAAGSPRPRDDAPKEVDLAKVVEEANARAARELEKRRASASSANRSVSRTRAHRKRVDATRRLEMRAQHQAAMAAAEARRQRMRSDAEDRHAAEAAHAAEVAARRSHMAAAGLVAGC